MSECEGRVGNAASSMPRQHAGPGAHSQHGLTLRGRDYLVDKFLPKADFEDPRDSTVLPVLHQLGVEAA